MGVFDGHGGPACAQVISKRLLSYIAAALLPIDTLRKYIKEEPKEDLIETLNDRVSLFVDDIINFMLLIIARNTLSLSNETLL